VKPVAKATKDPAPSCTLTAPPPPRHEHNNTHRLGEASGAALALPMLRAAAAVVSEMGTLQEALALG